MKSTTKSASGTSFHNTIFEATPSQLLEILGEPESMNNDGMDKTNFDWTLETETGDVFTVYDWKYYTPLNMDTVYEWHIGGKNKFITEMALDEIKQILNYKN